MSRLIGNNEGVDMALKAKGKSEGILLYFEEFSAGIWRQIGARVFPIKRDTL